jgi:hypothetical protein
MCYTAVEPALIPGHNAAKIVPREVFHNRGLSVTRQRAGRPANIPDLDPERPLPAAPSGSPPRSSVPQASGVPR